MVRAYKETIKTSERKYKAKTQIVLDYTEDSYEDTIAKWSDKNCGTAYFIDGTATVYELFNPETCTEHLDTPIAQMKAIGVTIQGVPRVKTTKTKQQMVRISLTQVRALKSLIVKLTSSYEIAKEFFCEDEHEKNALMGVSGVYTKDLYKNMYFFPPDVAKILKKHLQFS